MNLFNILDEIEKVDPEVYGRISERRSAIKNITSFGTKVAAAAMPFALGTVFSKAYAQSASTPSVVDVLNFALTLEYLEASYYNAGQAKSGFWKASDKTNYLDIITLDENNHVKFLQGVIMSLKGTPVDRNSLTFDFSAGNGTGTGPFQADLSDYTTFLEVAQVFEDTGVRAYKGQAPNLIGNQIVLTAALGIHAVEARHASALRQIRGVTPWITSTSALGNDTGVSLVDGNYDGEQNLTQGTITDVTKLPALSGSTTVTTATAAFDEPLTMQQVLDLLVGKFIVK